MATEPLHPDSAPDLPVDWCNHLGRHGASFGLAGDQGEPAALPQTNRQHRATVKFSEYGLYTLLLAQPATGLLTTLFGGRPFALYLWQFPALMPRDLTLQAAFHFSHELGAWAFACLVVSHAAAALFHHFVLRDDVLEFMAPAIAMARPKQKPATGHIVSETL